MSYYDDLQAQMGVGTAQGEVWDEWNTALLRMDEIAAARGCTDFTYGKAVDFLPTQQMKNDYKRIQQLMRERNFEGWSREDAARVDDMKRIQDIVVGMSPAAQFAEGIDPITAAERAAKAAREVNDPVQAGLDFTKAFGGEAAEQAAERMPTQSEWKLYLVVAVAVVALAVAVKVVYL